MLVMSHVPLQCLRRSFPRAKLLNSLAPLVAIEESLTNARLITALCTSIFQERGDGTLQKKLICNLRTSVNHKHEHAHSTVQTELEPQNQRYLLNTPHIITPIQDYTLQPDGRPTRMISSVIKVPQCIKKRTRIINAFPYDYLIDL